MKPPTAILKFCLAIVLATPAQAAVREAWIARHTLSPTGTNQAVAIALDQQGNVIVGGHGTSTNGDYDYVMVKYSPTGNRFLEEIYSGEGDDQVRSMVLDAENNTLLTGTSITVKYDMNGREQWQADYGGRGIAVDPAGEVYLTGFDSTSFSTVKLSRNAGTNLWVRLDKILPPDRGSDVSQVIAVDAAGNVFIAGEVTCYWDSKMAYENRRIISYDSDGNFRWSTSVFPAGCEFRKVSNRGLRIDSRGDVIVTGNAYGIGKTFSTAGHSSSGSFLWSYYLDPADFEGVQAMAIGADNATYLTGSSGECVTIRLTNGVPEWTRLYGSTQTGYHFGNAIALDSSGNVYVTGQSPGVGTGNDYATIKYSPSGQELWVQRYDGPAHGDDVATAIAVAPDGSVYVTGWSTTSSNLVEITTIKYVQSPSLTVETNRNVNLQFFGAPGASNRVQATTDFLDWLDLGLSVAGPDGLLHFQDTNAPTFPFRFYRTVSP